MDSSEASGDGPLDGVRVLSLATFVAGNVCALLLTELGADVVKVEARDRPEALRSYHSVDHGELLEPAGTPITALFAGLTRGMRSVSIDAALESGRDVLRRLAAGADVVIENQGPAKLHAWGCSFVELRAANPRLVMLSISGYGATGPYAGHRAYASNINNFLGLTDAWANDGTHFDVVAGIHGASAVLAGLRAVGDGGRAVALDLAQTEAGATFMAPLYLDYLANGREGHARPNEVPGARFSGVIECAGDDAWLAVELEDDRDWTTACACLADGRDIATVDEMQRILGAWAGDLTPMQAALTLQRAGLAAAPVQNSEDLWRDPQLRSRGSFCEVDHPDVGRFEYPNSPSRLTMTRSRADRRAPRLGEHTTAVLSEWLGYDDRCIADLHSSGAVWDPAL